ncbi:M15 family metallopeptidase [Solibacillus sp. CAU 1738]|uniref:M15 family metallopeptidase n=1 Tax=Solibacillus sp. CAU 1738 TaxID=3140363 RepID=UPI003260ECB2
MKKLMMLIAIIALGYFGKDQVISTDTFDEDIAFSPITVQEDATYFGDLILVDSEHPVDNSALPNDVVALSTLKATSFSFDPTIELSGQILQPFYKMIDAANADGVSNFIINSSYRSQTAQQQLFETMGTDLALPPGYSEHNAGLSVDIGSTTGIMEGSKEAAWLEKNAARYGFILRYPPNKSHITGIQHEPWHFRYVGLPHSDIIAKNNWTLEEYLAHLQQEKSITTHIDGHQYEVIYYDLTDSLNIPVPTTHSYKLSGDNMGGMIVTIKS